MDGEVAIETERLLLRRWKDSDRRALAAMNADTLVMEHFPGVLTPGQPDTMVDRIEEEFEPRGFGLWALEEKETAQFAGFTGLHAVWFEAHFTPAVEIGWRLARSAWGKGLATEAALRALAFGFRRASLDEIVSFTIPANRRSVAVMKRIGMKRDREGDFEHPSLLDGLPKLLAETGRVEREV